MNEKLKIAIIFACIFVLGFLTSQIYTIISEDIDYQRKIDGFFMRGGTEELAEDFADSKDEYGDWVCVNVREMDYDKAYEVCVHECSHKAYSEIFAEECEKDFERCSELLKNERRN